MSQQTILRVQTNIPSNINVTGSTALNVLSGSYSGYTGTGTSSDPYTYSRSGGSDFVMRYEAESAGSVFITFSANQVVEPRFAFDNYLRVVYLDASKAPFTGATYPTSEQVYYGNSLGNIQYDVNSGDRLLVYYYADSGSGTTVSGTTYFVPNQESVSYTPNTYDNLDLYDDVPIKINKSFAELQDIAKKNSDYSVNLTLPGTKKNNRFFETFYNVDMNLLFFDVTKRVPCDVLIDDQAYFRGYLKLNKINVQNSSAEYDVTLYSTISDIFGKIGNNLLKDLNFNDAEYHFNHQFHWKNIISQYQLDPYIYNIDTPQRYFYPIVHNGYNYDGDDVILSGSTDNVTRLYTSSGPISGYTSTSDWYTAGGQNFRINSPLTGIVDNQLKPALNVYSLIKLMFKQYGYTINSKFFESPWFKNIHMYGYFSSSTTKLSYIWEPGNCLPLSGVDIRIDESSGNIYIVKAGTSTPVTCCETVVFTLQYDDEGYTYAYIDYEIPPGDYSTPILGQVGYTLIGVDTTNTDGYSWGSPSFDPLTSAGQFVPITDNDIVDFSLMVDTKLKQIDLLSSIAKKFNLVFTPNLDDPNEIIIEPYDYYINSGDIHDWTEKLSYDKGFTVEPAQNYIESTISFNDSEDGDDGNKIFKDTFNRLYGENIAYNPTDFKSTNKEVKTIFSPEVVRTWDTQPTSGNIGLPLGMNYVGSSSEKDGGSVAYQYKGLKSKPKLFYWIGNLPPFVDEVGKTYTLSNINTNVVRICPSGLISPFGPGQEQWGSVNIPAISHTNLLGNPDENKVINDNLTLLFGSETPVDLGVATFNTFTNNNAFNTFYQNRITNIYDKNTRFISGKFHLTLPDVQNLKPNDLIKINEQYFTWNKIKEFNLTDPELTQVELIQTNRVVKEYPDRYFIYQYCDGAQYDYKFKTYFDYTQAQEPDGDRYNLFGYSPSVMTNYFWATFYDYMVGQLGGDVSGFTFTVFDGVFYKCQIREVSQTEWESSSADNWRYDPARFGLHSFSRTLASWEYEGFEYPLYLNGSGKAVLNAATDCSAMGTLLTSLGITASTPSSPDTPVPTPTPTATPTPEVTPTPITGDYSILLEYNDDNGDPDTYAQVYVDGDLRYQRHNSTDPLYVTYCDGGETLRLVLRDFDTVAWNVGTLQLIRRDYTNDDQGGDMGIINTPISLSGAGNNITDPSPLYTGDYLWIEWPLTTNPDAYNSEYRINFSVLGPLPTPTPTGPTPTPSPTGTPTPTPTATPTPTPSPTPVPAGTFVTSFAGGTQFAQYDDVNNHYYIDSKRYDGSFNQMTWNPTFSLLYSYKCVSVLPNNKVIYNVDGRGGSISNYYYVRFNSDGSWDNTFTSPFSSTGFLNNNILAYSEHLYADSNTVYVGTGVHPNTKVGYIYRFNESGTYIDGVTGLTSSASQMSNGKYCVLNSSYELVIYNDDWTLDSTIYTPTGTTGTIQASHDPVVYPTPDGGYLIWGYEYYDGNQSTNLYLHKITSSGTYDTTFNNNLPLTDGAGGGITSINIKSDGSMILSVYQRDGLRDPRSLSQPNYGINGVFKILSDGSFDTSFISYSTSYPALTEGLLYIDYNNSYPTGLLVPDACIDSSDRVVIVGNFTKYNNSSVSSPVVIYG